MVSQAAGQDVLSPAAGPDYIAGLVRAGDQDRYWAGLFMPRPARDHLFALYAYNIELARIGEQVREPQLGEIRLQWWHDTFGEAGPTTGHPVADALLAARNAYASVDLGPLFAAMLDARRTDIHREPIGSMKALETYLEGTAGALFQIGALMGGAALDENLISASRQAAMAYGLTGIMRALPYYSARGQLMLPHDFLGAFGVDGASVLAGEESEGLKTALGVLRVQALEHLENYRALAPRLPAATLPVFLPLALVPAYLRRLGDPSHRALADIAQLNPLSRFSRIWWANLRGRV
jgi:phytoene synthase